MRYVLSDRELFNSEEDKEKWFYPREWVCSSCEGKTKRVDGNGYYLYGYRCQNKKCKRFGGTLYGKMRDQLDREDYLLNERAMMGENNSFDKTISNRLIKSGECTWKLDMNKRKVVINKHHKLI